MVLFDKVTIGGLFGREDPEIIEFDSSSGYKVIYGLNGCGKSTILRLIDAALNWKPLILWQTQFDYIEFEVLGDDSIFLPLPDFYDISEDTPMAEFTDSAMKLLYSIPDDGFQKLVDYGIVEHAIDDELPDFNLLSEPELNSMITRKFRIVREEEDYDDENPEDYEGSIRLTTTSTVDSTLGISSHSPEWNSEYRRLAEEVLPLYGNAMDTSPARTLGSDVYLKEIKKRGITHSTVKQEFRTPSPHNFEEHKLQRIASELHEFFNVKWTFDSQTFGSQITDKTGERIAFGWFVSKYASEIMPEPAYYDADWRYRPHSLSHFLDVVCVDKEGYIFSELWSQDKKKRTVSNIPFTHFSYDSNDRSKRANEFGIHYKPNEYSGPFDPSVILLRPDRLTSLLREDSNPSAALLPSIEDSAGLLRLISEITEDINSMFVEMENLESVYVGWLFEFEIWRKSQDSGVTGKGPYIAIGETEDPKEVDLNDDWKDAFKLLESLNEKWQFESPIFTSFYRTFSKFISLMIGEDVFEINDFEDAADAALCGVPTFWVILNKNIEEVNQRIHGDLEWLGDEDLDDEFIAQIEPHQHVLSSHYDLLAAIERLGLLANLSSVVQERMNGKRISVRSDGSVVLVEDRQIILHEGEPKEVEEKVIDALSLSSGERHLLTMFLYLIREIKNDGSLILIDEPEMSLHINWQRRFIDDLLETLVKRYSELEGNPLWTSPHRFLIATHSPSIIANHLEHGVELGIGDLPQEEW